MVKKILGIVAVLIVAAAVVLGVVYAVHRQQQPVLLYEDAQISVLRCGRVLSVSDAVSGQEYRYTTMRVKRDSGLVRGVQAANTTVNTERLKIATVYNLVIVTEKETGDVLYIRVR